MGRKKFKKILVLVRKEKKQAVTQLKYLLALTRDFGTLLCI